MPNSPNNYCYTLNDHLSLIRSFFKHKQSNAEFEIRVINFLKKNKKVYVYNKFQMFLNFKGFLKTTESESILDKFAHDIYVDDNFKCKIKLILTDFNEYLADISKQTYEYKYLIEKKSLFLDSFIKFLNDRIKNLKSDCDNLDDKREKCECLINISYKNMNFISYVRYLFCHVQTEINETLKVDEFIQIYKRIYDTVRLKEINFEHIQVPLPINKKLALNVLDFNYKYSIISIGTQLTDWDTHEIINGLKIKIAKNPSDFTIYFLDNLSQKARSQKLENPNIISLISSRLSNLIFSSPEQIIISKEDKNERELYDHVYKIVDEANGFTHYSNMQITEFMQLKEIVIKKLHDLKSSLDSIEIHDLLMKDVDKIFETELPHFWSFRIDFIFRNLYVIQNFVNELLTPDERLLNVYHRLAKNDEAYKNSNHYIYYLCLTMMDNIMLKLLLKEEVSEAVKKDLENLSKYLSENEYPRSVILEEIYQRNYQNWKESFILESTNMIKDICMNIIILKEEDQVSSNQWRRSM